eukprot:3416973-Alexandrium_andersonii.AAC.1
MVLRHEVPAELLPELKEAPRVAVEGIKAALAHGTRLLFHRGVDGSHLVAGCLIWGGGSAPDTLNIPDWRRARAAVPLFDLPFPAHVAVSEPAGEKAGGARRGETTA